MAFGVSNSFKRGTIKTYSRQRVLLETSHGLERPRKRIRMDATGRVVEDNLGAPLEEIPGEEPPVSVQPETRKVSISSSVTAPSSPSAPDRAHFSSDALQEDDSPLSSPPSSPPRLPTPKKISHKPAFSFVKRKRQDLNDNSGSEPLSDITANARKLKKPRKALTQMQIDLGGEVRKTCRLCGMEYVPSVREDSALHSKYCAMNIGGVDLGKAFLRDDTVRKIHSERAAGNEREMVVTVDRQTATAARNRTRKVLEVVNAELSSADIDDEHLWGALEPEKKIETRKGSRDGMDKRGDRFKAFLYLVDDKCVGFCLAEKISSAFSVVRSKTEANGSNETLFTSKSSSVSISSAADIALLGISRIWISKSHREQGLAIELLDCARKTFFYGVEAPKDLVAFSQPTESGGRLAERWFGSETGWHVYCADE